MNLKLDIKLANGYKSSSQIARVLTENWAEREIYCPQCGINVNPYENNKPVADFFCSKCKEDYELKATKGNIGKKINDGAYKTMIERLESCNNPNFFFMSYNRSKLMVENFIVIPKHFFRVAIIEERKPLPLTARRAGWVGCNILLNSVPQSGKIYYVNNGKILNKKSVINDWQKTLFLRESKSNELKGWILDIMNCIDKLNKKEFKLDEMYNFASDLSKLHPKNKHIKDKIRQQLQFLRDKNYLEFKNRGSYKLI